MLKDAALAGFWQSLKVLLQGFMELFVFGCSIAHVVDYVGLVLLGTKAEMRLGINLLRTELAGCLTSPEKAILNPLAFQ